MRHRRHRRHHFHYGYGRDKAKAKKKASPWQKFIKANKHRKEFRKANGQLDLKKLAREYKHHQDYLAGKPDSRARFKQKLTGLRGLLDSIASRRKSGGSHRHHNARKMNTAQKLKMAARELKRLEKALLRANERYKAKQAREAAAKAAKAAKRASKPSAPASAKAEQEKADLALKEALAASNAAHRAAKAGGGFANMADGMEAIAKEEARLRNLYGGDMGGRGRKKKAKKKSAKKKAAKKSSSRKPPKTWRSFLRRNKGKGKSLKQLGREWKKSPHHPSKKKHKKGKGKKRSARDYGYGYDF